MTTLIIALFVGQFKELKPYKPPKKESLAEKADKSLTKFTVDPAHFIAILSSRPNLPKMQRVSESSNVGRQRVGNVQVDSGQASGSRVDPKALAARSKARQKHLEYTAKQFDISMEYFELELRFVMSGHKDEEAIFKEIDAFKIMADKNRPAAIRLIEKFHKTRWPVIMATMKSKSLEKNVSDPGT